MKITRNPKDVFVNRDGEMFIYLTDEEIAQIHKKSNIQWAKDILENYADRIANYDEIIKDEEQLLAFAELLDDKNLADNGPREIEAIEELFETVEIID